MKKYFYILFILLITLQTTGCQSTIHSNETLELAKSTENSVEVTISMKRDASDQLYLMATFTPTEPSLHLYSKDLPKNGFDGLGRPALLEIPNSSSIQATGELTESASSQPLAYGPQGLLVYPEGPITLSLPISFPAEKSGTLETISITYMACNQQGCRAPVQDKAITIKLPKL
ncbi:MAG: hypothetical protein U0Z26_13955 [Anaerolineales bacterium]